MKKLLAPWVLKSAFMLLPMVIVLAGCVPVAVVGGVAGGAFAYTLHCYGLGMVDNCPKEPPPEITAVHNNDVEALRALFEAKPSLYRNPERLNDILYRALSIGSLDVVRFLVPKYVDINGYSSRGGSTLLEMAKDNCKSASLLLDMGALPQQDNYRSGGFFRRVAQQAQGRNAPICLSTIKKIIAAGYVPTQKELDEAFKWAYEGWTGGDSVNERTGNPNIEMSDYLRSIGARYPSSTN